MNAKKFAIQFTSTVAAAAVGAVSTSAVFNVAVWKTAGIAAIVAAMPIIKKLLESAEDGELTSEEVDGALKEKP